MKNYYKILGVDPKADHASLRRAWLLKAHELHPDHNPDDPASEELFREALEAWRVLSDPFLRSRYDEGGGDAELPGGVMDEKIHHLFLRESTPQPYDNMTRWTSPLSTPARVVGSVCRRWMLFFVPEPLISEEEWCGIREFKSGKPCFAMFFARWLPVNKQ